MHDLGTCVKPQSYVAHMFYAWSFSHNTVVPVAKQGLSFYLSLDSCTILFFLGCWQIKEKQRFALIFHELIYHCYHLT